LEGGFLNYVMNEYTGTLECFSSSKLYVKQLNTSMEECCLNTKPFNNIVEENLTWVTGEFWSNFYV